MQFLSSHLTVRCAFAVLEQLQSLSGELASRKRRCVCRFSFVCLFTFADKLSVVVVPNMKWALVEGTGVVISYFSKKGKKYECKGIFNIGFRFSINYS
ncbi:hypothetical protein TNIN_144251 [Trichonephila inaurata madagascariensis]|uniref:Uncharacterized protein n=1 Tax=Trichonephila inaurata madagascariensis TaxID=2747483 RepID=A0A8X7BYI8_9ARAC|nr:hypothetical protein TNIN_144251 [Trichonephila inaurata madagascariensis]